MNQHIKHSELFFFIHHHLRWQSYTICKGKCMTVEAEGWTFSGLFHGLLGGWGWESFNLSIYVCFGYIALLYCYTACLFELFIASCIQQRINKVMEVKLRSLPKKKKKLGHGNISVRQINTLYITSQWEHWFVLSNHLTVIRQQAHDLFFWRPCWVEK